MIILLFPLWNHLFESLRVYVSRGRYFSFSISFCIRVEIVVWSLKSLGFMVFMVYGFECF